MEIFRQLLTFEIVPKENYLLCAGLQGLNNKMFWGRLWNGFIHSIPTRRTMTKDEALELIGAYERDPNAPQTRNNLRIVLASMPGQHKGEHTAAEVRDLVAGAQLCLAANADRLCDREKGHPGLHVGSDRNGKRVRWKE